MQRELANITVIASTKPPVEAIAILKDWRKEGTADIADAMAIVKTETAFIAAVDTVLSKLESIVNGLGVTPVEDADDDATDAAADAADEAAGEKMTVWESAHGLSPVEKILAYLKTGPKTLREITTELRKTDTTINYHKVYALVLHGTENLVSRGLVTFDGTYKPGRAALNVDYVEPAIYYQDYLNKILELDPEMTADDQVAVRMAEAIKVYTLKVLRADGSFKIATRTWGCIQNRRLIKAIEYMVQGSPTAGFDALHKLGRTDLMAEKIVVDYPERFSDKAVASAKRRLASIGALPTTA